MDVIDKSTGQVLATCAPETLGHVLAALTAAGSKFSAGDFQCVSTPAEKKMQLREAIDCVADAKSREGVISDVLGVVVVGLAQLAVALSKVKVVADVATAAQPLVDIGAAVDAAVKSGALTLPYMVKPGGAQGVLADMTALSNGVAAVFAAAQPPAK